ncbi:MAG: hypothetical protein WCX70_00840 [Candidatus Paceibacterota bacterium]|jgi:hypothetical protein
MQDEETMGPVIGIVLILAMIFFGGLFVFLDYNHQQNGLIIETPAKEEVEEEETSTATEIIFETEQEIESLPTE